MVAMLSPCFASAVLTAAMMPGTSWATKTRVGNAPVTSTAKPVDLGDQDPPGAERRTDHDHLLGATSHRDPGRIRMLVPAQLDVGEGQRELGRLGKLDALPQPLVVREVAEQATGDGPIGPVADPVRANEPCNSTFADSGCPPTSPRAKSPIRQAPAV